MTTQSKFIFRLKMIKIFLFLVLFLFSVSYAVDLTVTKVNCSSSNPDIAEFTFFSHDKSKYNISAIVKKPVNNVLVIQIS